MDHRIKRECLDRIEFLKEQGLLTDLNVTELFEEGKLCISEANMVFGQPCGVVHVLKNKPVYQKVVDKNFEIKHIATPYFAMAQNTSFGLMISILYVSHYPEQWENERRMLKEQKPFAFVYNIDEDYGEVGPIIYQIINGGPIRTA